MRLVMLLLATLAVSACADAPIGEDPEVGSFEGVDEDNDPTTVMDDGKSDLPRYEVPGDLPTLTAPEVIVSLDGLTVHLFDRATGFSEVYPAGVGIKNSAGRSITPTGHFRTGDDTKDAWWYVPRRTSPAYFGGFPFLRLDAENSEGANTYALHGPITEVLIRGYVSHGCIRMQAQDVIRLFWSVRAFAQVPVTIQREVERDAEGHRVDVGRDAVLFPAGAPIAFGASVGPRPF